MKITGMFLVVVLCLFCMSAVRGSEELDIDERFIEGIFDKVKDALNKTFNKAKDSFKKVSSVNFDDAVDILIDLIHSDMTVSQCEKVCKLAASTIFAGALGDANKACHPLCDAALAKLEKIAG